MTGTVTVGPTRHDIDGPFGFVDDSAGYHDRHTAWRWSAGVGTSADGRAVAWNLVDGIHDDPRASERTLWVDGEPREIGPNAVRRRPGLGGVRRGRAAGLHRVGRPGGGHGLGLLSRATASRSARSRARCPAGWGWPRVYGVMEDHDVHW